MQQLQAAVHRIRWEHTMPVILKSISQRRRVEDLFEEIAQEFGVEIDTMELAVDHVHIFLDFPSRYAIAKVVGILKSISASRVFEEVPEIKKQLWSEVLWEDGYIARTVGYQVIAE